MSGIHMRLPLRRFGGRIARNLTAQLYGQVATLVIQLASIPLLISAWGLETYGVWLFLTAVPTYLTLCDLGFTFTAKNAMSIEAARGDRAAALQTFQSVFALLLAVIGGAGLLLGGLVWMAPLEQWFKLADTPSLTVRTVLSAQFSAVLFYQFFLLLCAGLRADGRPATEAVFATTSRLFEATSVCAVAVMGADIALAALAGLASRLISLGVVTVHVRKTVTWLSIGVTRGSFSRIRTLLLPSLSYMLIPASGALLIQGPIVVLAAVAGPTSVALFSVTRTVTRLGMSGANMLNFAFTPEYSVSFGSVDTSTFRSHIRLHGILIGAGVIAYCLVMALWSSTAIEMLSHGEVAVVGSLTAILGAAVAFEMLWSAAFSPLAASNSHMATALVLALLSAIALSVAVVFSTIWSLAIALLAVHVAMLLVSTPTYLRIYRHGPTVLRGHR